MIKVNKKLAVLMFLVFGVFLMSFIMAQFSSSNVQFTAPGGASSSFLRGQGVDIFPIFNDKMCGKGQDFILQIAPFGCSPSIVRSDLLEEQNVPVFCQITATQINPLIDVKAIESMSFRGRYPKEVSGVGFYPARAAVKSRTTLLNSPVLGNIGYAVIVLRQQEKESEMPDFVEGNLTAFIRYDIENAFGIGKATYYLPEFTNDEWEQKFRQYGFWNGKGYLRAEAIEADSALISVYSDQNNKISTFNLKKGQTSNQIFLPGFYCLANLKIRLDGLEAPNTRAKLNINGQIVEVADRDKFLENKCQVRDVEKKGINQLVDISCRTDEGVERFELKIVPKIRLEIGGIEKKVSVGDFLYDSSDGKKFVYLAYASTKKNSDNEEDLFVYFMAMPQVKDKLSESELSSVDLLVTMITYQEITGVGVMDFTANIFKAYAGAANLADKYIREGKEISRLDYDRGIDVYGKQVKLLGFSGAKDKGFGTESLSTRCVTNGEFAPEKCEEGDGIKAIKKVPVRGSIGGLIIVTKQQNGNWKNENSPTEYTNAQIKELSDKIYEYTINSQTYTSLNDYLLTLQKSDENKDLKQNYDNAMRDYREIIDRYPSDKENANSQETFGERALINAIGLANSAEQKKNMTELCKEFEERYPDSKTNLPDCDNALKTSNSEISSHTVFINGKVKTISFERVYEPTLEDYSAEIVVRSNKGANLFVLRKKQIIYLDDSQEEFIQLLELNKNSAVVNVNIKPETELEAILKATIYSSRKILKKDEGDSFGSKYIFTLTKVNLKNVARVSVIPRVDNAGTEANISFKIGIEKRGIQLSPDEIKDRIGSLDKSIEKWEDTSETLGNVVRGFNAACLATGTYLTAKNFLSNLDGKSIARTEVMTSEGGYTDICKNEIADTKESIDSCFLRYSDEIDSDVEAVFQAMQSQEAITEGNLCDKLSGIVGQLGNTIVNPRDSSKTFSSEDIKETANADSEGKCEKISLSEAKDLERLNLILNSGASSQFKEAAEIKRFNILSDINANVQGYADFISIQGDITDAGLNVGVTSYATEDSIVAKYSGGTVLGSEISKDWEGKDGEIGYPIEIITLGSKKYAAVLQQTKGSDYSLLKAYEYKGIGSNKQIIFGEDKTNEVDTHFSKFVKYDRTTYENKFINPEVRYFETEPYKGLPAIVPFDTSNGWYARMKQTLPGFGKIRTYDDSSRIASFELCNVGENGKPEASSGYGDDICRTFIPGTGQVIGTFPGLESGQTNTLVRKAIRAIDDASRAYEPGITGRIRILNEEINVGPPAVDVPEFQCQNFMSPKDCLLLFNACDPVVCPSSRCNLGGSYHVADVVQSGIVGSTLLCLPNIKENIAVPICLSGVKAGIDGLISVQKNYRNCLQENLDTGATIGICDEIHSIYLCDFFWNQAAPFSQILIPKIFEFITGQNSPRGGGEYLGVKSAWQNAQNSVSYMTQYYAGNSFQAFKARATEGIGKAICRNFVSATYPSDIGLESLIEPRSPPQFAAWFSEKTFTTATVPATSQYKVFYHIYAGEDSLQNIGAYYSVFLKSPAGTSFYQTNPTVTVASGYIAKGDFASETRDFTAPAGYKELCIRVNAQEECGFKQVTTEFSINYLQDKYLQEQASQTDIQTESECVSGTPSLYSLANPNLQAGVTEAVNPQLYDRGIVRVCATDNPGKGTDALANTAKARWQEVGTCDQGAGKVKCYIDTKSVENVITSLDIEDQTLEEVSRNNLNKLLEEKDSLSDEEIKKIGGKEAKEKIRLITDTLLDKAFFTYQKAKLLLIRGDAYAELALNVIKKIFPQEEIPEVEKEGVVEIVEEGEEIVEEAPLVTERYEERYEQFEDLFNKYSDENTPINWNEDDFKALLIAIAQKESSLGYPNGRSKDDRLLMGYDDANRGSDGAENQIKAASATLKRALNNQNENYNVCNKETGDNKVKCILSVYNTGESYGIISGCLIVCVGNPDGKQYAKEVFDFWLDWKVFLSNPLTHSYIIEGERI